MYKMTNDLYLNYKMSSSMDVAYDSDIVLIWVSIIMYVFRCNNGYCVVR